MGAPHVGLHPGRQKALTLQLESGSLLGGSPRRVTCRVCEESVLRDSLQSHSRVCAMLEAICKQVGGVGAGHRGWRFGRQGPVVPAGLLVLWGLLR